MVVPNHLFPLFCLLTLTLQDNETSSQPPINTTTSATTFNATTNQTYNATNQPIDFEIYAPQPDTFKNADPETKFKSDVSEDPSYYSDDGSQAGVVILGLFCGGFAIATILLVWRLQVWKSKAKKASSNNDPDAKDNGKPKESWISRLQRLVGDTEGAAEGEPPAPPETDPAPQEEPPPSPPIAPQPDPAQQQRKQRPMTQLKRGASAPTFRPQQQDPQQSFEPSTLSDDDPYPPSYPRGADGATTVTTSGISHVSFPQPPQRSDSLSSDHTDSHASLGVNSPPKNQAVTTFDPTQGQSKDNNRALDSEEDQPTHKCILPDYGPIEESSMSRLDSEPGDATDNTFFRVRDAIRPRTRAERHRTM